MRTLVNTVSKLKRVPLPRVSLVPEFFPAKASIDESLATNPAFAKFQRQINEFKIPTNNDTTHITKDLFKLCHFMYDYESNDNKNLNNKLTNTQELILNHFINKNLDTPYFNEFADVYTFKDRNESEAFYCADFGDIIRQHKQWRTHLPFVKPFYGMYIYIYILIFFFKQTSNLKLQICQCHIT